jgi:membrane protein DedA with SNARE-associated domain
MVSFLNSWGYVAVFVVCFVSAMGLPVGSELVIIAGGALASGKVTSDPHHLNLVAVIVLATLGEVLGSLAGYLLGLVGGRPLVDRFGRYVLLTHKDLDRAEAWFARHGEPLVLFGRFIPLLRSFVSFAAGLGEMAVGRFLVFTTIACAVWCAALASIGDAIGPSYEHVHKVFSDVGYVAAALAVVAVAVLFLHRFRTVREERR